MFFWDTLHNLNTSVPATQDQEPGSTGTSLGKRGAGCKLGPSHYTEYRKWKTKSQNYRIWKQTAEILHNVEFVCGGAARIRYFFKNTTST